MTAKKNVLVDIDNTIATTQVAYIQYANKQSGKRFIFEEITKEYSDDPHDEFEAIVRSFITSSDYASTIGQISPYATALEGLKGLHNAGFGVCIASSRIENWHEPTVHWLDEHGFLPYVDQIYLRTSDIDSADFKVGSAQAIRAVAAFDDSYATASVLPFVDTFFLIDQPWNRNVTALENVQRSMSFSDAVDAFLGTRIPS